MEDASPAHNQLSLQDCLSEDYCLVWAQDIPPQGIIYKGGCQNWGLRRVTFIIIREK